MIRLVILSLLVGVGTDAAELNLLWRRDFDQLLPFGDHTKPANEMNLAGAKGSRNLAVANGELALIAADGREFPNDATTGYVTVLDTATGRTLNCVRIHTNIGINRVYRWPYNGVSMSGDTVPGFVVTRWDPESGIFFTGQCGYHTAFTCYRPLANAATYEPGKFQPGVPAYERRAKFEDAFGRVPADFVTHLGIGKEEPGLQPWAWGLSGFIKNPIEKKARFDFDLATAYGQGSTPYYNNSAFFAVDPRGPLIGLSRGDAWGHNTAGNAYLFNKYTGMKAVTKRPLTTIGRLQLRPFTCDGVRIENGRVYCIGPSEDRDGDGQLGVGRPEGRMPSKLDQGLALWAYDYTTADLRPNDGFTGPGTNETAILKPAFAHTFPSRYQPDPADLDSYGQSYYECDGFYRPKAFLVDGRSVWAAWKPSQAEPVELIQANDAGARTWPLGVGKGLKGVDLWPKLSMATVGGAKQLVYYTGYAQHRRRYLPADPEAVMRRHTHGGKTWDELPADQRASFLDQARKVGIWTEELLAPHGPAELAVFDAATGKIRWTYDLSSHHPSLPANDFWGYLDQSHLVINDRWAYVAWVDTTGKDASLRVVMFDLAKDAAVPVEKTFPLGFPSAGNRKTALFDLVAGADRLFALVTRSDVLWIRDPRWQSQIVLALGYGR